MYDAVWTYARALDRVLRRHPGALENIHSNENTKYVYLYRLLNCGHGGQYLFNSFLGRVQLFIFWIILQLPIEATFFSLLL